MKLSFVSLFPNLIKPYFNDSILARAIASQKLELDFFNPRDFTKNKNLKVDEYMIGGGAGLLMFCQPIDEVLCNVKQNDQNVHIVFVSPVGKKFNQNDAKRLAKKEHICFVCGRYEGIDERMIEKWSDEIFCIGDFILTGGELGALCMADAIARNIEGVLGNSDSLEIESFEENLLEAPSFAKPDSFEGNLIISEFLKGNHSKIQSLKSRMAHCKTMFFRPDLYQKVRYNLRKNYEK